MKLCIFRKILVFTSIFVQYCVSDTTFKSCQGTSTGTSTQSYINALSSCEDKGEQQLSSGGNVTILVKRATNIPNRDSTGPSAGVSDPYVKFIVGSSSKSSKFVRNDLNPVWNQNVSLGFLTSATLIEVEVWDKDSGLEFSDDRVLSSTVRVPFCSSFPGSPNANTTTVDCGQPFGCSSDDSLWAMPTRKLCHYTGEIIFRPDIILYIEFFIVPFTLTVEAEYLAGAGPTTNVMSNQVSGKGYSINFGKPFSDKSAKITNIPQMPAIQPLVFGSLALMTSTTNADYGAPEDIMFYAGVNFPANIHVCRYQSDNAKGIPKWITSEYSSSMLLVNRLIFGGDINSPFVCYWRHVDGTVKNKYGGVTSGAIPFYSNTVLDSKGDKVNNLYNYIVLAIPVTMSSAEEVVTILFDSLSFVSFAFSYGLVWAYLVLLIDRFLAKIDYRVDRISSYLSTRVLSGDSSSILASLFLMCNQSPNNIQYRAHLFHARNSIVMIMCIPFLLLLSWGFALVSVVKPAGIGFVVAFGGIAALFLGFGLRLWEKGQWRLSLMALTSLSSAVLFFLVFLLSIIFVDPAVTKYGHGLNFTALSLVFGTINCVPLLLLTFKQDSTQSSHLREVLKKIAEALFLINEQKRATKKGVVFEPAPYNPNPKDLKVNKLLHGILGDMYTINPLVPAFRYSAVMQEIPESAMHDKAEVLPEGEKPLTNSERFKEEHNLYYSSLFPLLVYFIIAASRTDYPSLAFLNCLALMLLDGIHLSISHGDIKWTSGFKITLLLAGRVLIMGSPTSIWVINYSAAFMLYAIILAQETINQFLPSMSRRQAGEVAFGGLENDQTKSPDIAGTSYFSLGLLTFAFSSILLVCAFKDAEGDLPIPMLVVLGLHNWPSYVFGLIALLLTVTICLFSATIRAFYLERHGLLKGWARDNYLIRKEISVPLTFAFFTEMSILTFGIVVYAATHSAAVLVGAIFLPAIVLMLGYAWQVWVSNDYDLVKWPPSKEQSEAERLIGEGDTPTNDLEVAFDMIEGLFNDKGAENNAQAYREQQEQLQLLQLTNLEEDEDAVPESDAVVKSNAATSTSAASGVVVPLPDRTLKGFKLPPLKVTGNKVENEIKMPPLPLKSVLRRKRQNLGIKTRLPIVSDLRVRDDVVDPDRFGNGDEPVFDLDDPWAQFEKEAEEEEAALKKKKGTTYAVAKRESIWKNPTYLAIKRSKFCQWCSKTLQSCISFMQRKVKVYPSIYKATGDNEDDEEEDDKAFTSDLEKGNTARNSLPDENSLLVQDEDRVLTNADIALLTYSQALYGGYLSRKNYMALAAWYGGLLAVMFFGITLSLTVSPVWLGHVIWISIWMFLLTGVPLVKYFNTYTFDPTMRTMARCVALLHFVFCLTFFLAQLKGDIGQVGSLWILDYFFYYPIFLYIAFVVYKWYDNDWKVISKDWNGDGDVTIREYIRYFSAIPLTMFVIIFVWQMYTWISGIAGVVATLLLITIILTGLFMRDWSMNDYYISPLSLVVGGMALNVVLLITACISLLSDKNPILPGSVFFFVLAFKQACRIAARYMLMDQDLIVFFSPYIFPVYSYDAKTHDIIDESPVIKDLLYLQLIGLTWGCFVAIFFYPIHIGVAIACITLLTIAAAGAFAVSFVPMKLARIATMLSPDSIVECVQAAKSKFGDRRLPMTFEIPDWEGEEAPEDDGTEINDKRTSLEKQKQRTSLSLALELASDLRSLKYVKAEVVAEVVVSALEEQDEYDLVWYKQWMVNIRATAMRLVDMVPINKMAGWRRHNQGTFTWPDAGMELFVTGRGPFGLLGFEGYFYRSIMKWKESPRMIKYYPAKWLDYYDDVGNSFRTIQLSENLNISGLLSGIVEHDKALDWTFREESRCAVHFFLLMLVGADAKMQREQVLFQKFLREYRFRLASNGIKPPSNIFSSTSYSSINIPLVAVWLLTLTSEERDRFYTLKAAFSDEQREKDELVDNSDYQTAFEATQLLKEREGRDKEMTDRLSIEINKRKEQRIQEFADSCEGFERQKFQNRRELWVSDLSCFVDLKDMELYERFKLACLTERNESLECIQQALVDIEAAQRDTRLGEYGRAYQYIDGEFQPSDASIGHGECNSYVLGWRCAPGISESVQLFDGGTHPDAVEEGVFHDSWLLSAINMLVAAGSEMGGGFINEQIKELFVAHESSDGEKTLHTEVGAYCVQLFRNNEWFPVLVDDLLPMRKKEHWTNENRGMACAHNRECRGLWVSLVEKAFAKYMGSYSALEKGYVHHALQDLTGCEAECITLAAVSRGIGKRALWDTLMRFKRNGYILGAGTGDSKLVDKEIQDVGIVFNAAYTIYDVKRVNGHKLLKLRNPPGDHDEWRGDWSDKSALWSRKLKRKLGMKDAMDNTFFLSFDDFCNVFRNLYVCKYYNPKQWHNVTQPGLWKKSDEAAVEQMDMMNQFLEEQGEEGANQSVVNLEEVNRKKAKARLDSAGGLPTKHNPGCILENNPHYSLRINRPTDLRISVTQYIHKGSKAALPVPFSVLIVRNKDPRVPMRLQTLIKEDVVYSSGQPRSDKIINLYADALRPGLYMVLIAAYMSGMEGSFNVSMLSNYRCEFLPVWPPLWMLKGDKMPAAAMAAESKLSNSAKAKNVTNVFQKGLKSLIGSTGDGFDEDEDNDDDDDDDDK